MKRSTNHILTTHTGSLPRPRDLVDMVLRKEKKQWMKMSLLMAGVCLKRRANRESCPYET
jgi:hypothetical protein